jgi:hypothetical protein
MGNGQWAMGDGQGARGKGKSEIGNRKSEIGNRKSAISQSPIVKLPIKQSAICNLQSTMANTLSHPTV